MAGMISAASVSRRYVLRAAGALFFHRSAAAKPDALHAFSSAVPGRA